MAKRRGARDEAAYEKGLWARYATRHAATKERLRNK